MFRFAVRIGVVFRLAIIVSFCNLIVVSTASGSVPSASLGAVCKGKNCEFDASVGLNDTFTLQRQKFTLNEKLTLTLRVSNAGNVNIDINDPFSVDESMKLKLVMGKDTEWAILGSAFQEQPHGVPHVPQVISVPNKRPVDILLDLHKYFKLDRPGSYSLSVNYTWQDGQIWQSPDITFEIAEPSGEALGIVPNEASRSGFHGLYWLETEAELSRVLVKPWSVQDKKMEIVGAVQAGTVPAGSQVTLSMQPAGDPMPERWVVGLANDNLYLSYFSDDNMLRLPTVAIKLPQPMTLITPVLADLVPDNGRPGCAVGMIATSKEGSVFNLLEIANNGQSRAANPVALPGRVSASWALAADKESRTYYFVISRESSTMLYSIACPRGLACGPVEPLLKVKGKFLVGDLRLIADGKVVLALLQDHEGSWTNNLYSGLPSGTMDLVSQDKLDKAGEPCEAKLIRIDENSLLHTLYICDDALHYVKHGEKKSHWSSRDILNVASFYDLVLLSRDKVYLIYYHKEQSLKLEEF